MQDEVVTSQRLIELSFRTRIYYLFVVPFYILASVNMLILLLCGVDAHYQMLVEVSEFAVNARRMLYGVLFHVLDALPGSILFGYAVVGSLPISVRFWKFRKSPAGRFLRARKNKRDISDTDSTKVTVE